MQTAPFLNNGLTVDALQRLLFSEAKPTEPTKLLPIDIAVMTYLIVRRCVDHSITDSQATLASRLCAERQAIAASLERLEKVGWITVSGRGRWNTKAISINFETLPAMQPVRDAISDEAKQIVAKYRENLERVGRRKFPKNWFNRQLPATQRIITACDGDLTFVRKVLTFAFLHPAFQARTRMSMYHTLCAWPKITKAYREQEGTKDEPQPIQRNTAA